MVRGPENKAAGRMHTEVIAHLSGAAVVGAGEYRPLVRNEQDVGQIVGIASMWECFLRPPATLVRLLDTLPLLEVAGLVARVWAALVDGLAVGSLALEGDFRDHSSASGRSFPVESQ